MTRCQAKQRNSQEIATYSRYTNGFAIFLWLFGLALTLDVYFTDGTELVLPGVRFILSYPTRFLAFYEPKVMGFVAMLNDTIERLDISDQVSGAWDFAAALVTLVCVHHVIDSARTTVANRLRSSIDTTSTQPSDN
ncbi:hypothetical protein PHMEG_00013823 [Phytophthora megakarya]|uniref:Uncharacterized protein n=1 Tax=Phytophthora megakarya TaxID=4795 RepID=A0A225W7G3_9STRA|nr:hypothetical protein PHMEG_00013823 [Phytophthora megakarya]